MSCENKSFITDDKTSSHFYFLFNVSEQTWSLQYCSTLLLTQASVMQVKKNTHKNIRVIESSYSTQFVTQTEKKKN